MRAAVAVLVLLACLVNGGCAIIEKERTNRGGYIDYVLDQSLAAGAMQHFRFSRFHARAKSGSQDDDR